LEASQNVSFETHAARYLRSVAEIGIICSVSI